MVKSFFKELLIILLLLFAIITLLGVLFYNYMPNKETLPSKAEEYILAYLFGKNSHYFPPLYKFRLL